MIYTVVFYLLTEISPNTYGVKRFPLYELHSIIPIVECTGIIKKNDVTYERKIDHICKTEELYAQMTGKKTVVITISGAYQT